MNHIVPIFKYIDNLHDIKIKGAFFFDESCKALTKSTDYNDMFGFSYGIFNRKKSIEIKWIYSKLMNTVYIVLFSNDSIHRKVIPLYGTNFNETHDYKIEISRRVTNTTIENNVYTYADTIKVFVDDKCVHNDTIYNNNSIIRIFGNNINFYEK